MGQKNNKKNRILLVSYLFPPAGGIPVQRILSLARFLPENDYEVHVLCCSNPGVPTMDPSLLERVPQEVRVHRVFSPELSFEARQRVWSILSPGGGKKAAKKVAAPAGGGSSPSLLKRAIQGVMRRIYCPDPEVLWVPFATRAARKIVREFGIDTMLITMPPYSSILVGLQLKKELGDALTLVADFRDEWLDYYLNAFPFYRSAHIHKRAAAIERETAERADLIVAVTPTVQQQMRERYPDVSGEKFGLVWNGYDPLALEGFCRDGRQRKHGLGEGKVLISYAGTMHETSSPKQYFEALDRLPEEVRGRVVTRMIGRVTDDLEHLLHGRKSEIQRYGFLPQKEAFGLLEETDYLLLIQHHAPSLPGKAFEYLGMGKPILAIAAPGSELARLIDETGAGMWADPGDLAAVERMLTAAVLGSARMTGDGSLVERFDRRNLTREYARLMRGES
jgi:hypothetical protein